MTEQRNGAGGRGFKTRVLLPFIATAIVILAAAAVWWFTQDGGNAGQEPGRIAEQPNDQTDEGTDGNAGETPQEPDEGAGGEEDSAAEPGEDQPYDPDKDVTQEELDATYDIVITNGRVINPETGLDREGLNIGITGKTIGVITSHPLKGSQVIDAAGLVVAPGFIDNL